MNKGLEELEKLGEEYPSEGSTLWFQYSERFAVIEKELKKAEKNEIVLNIFKNALTIEHHDLPMVDPHDDSEDIVAYAFKTLTTIRQNELDKSLRQTLREWVLKNAFPKEIKALKIIKKLFKKYPLSFNYMFEELSDKETDFLKEVIVCH